MANHKNITTFFQLCLNKKAGSKNNKTINSLYNLKYKHYKFLSLKCMTIFRLFNNRVNKLIYILLLLIHNLCNSGKLL